MPIRRCSRTAACLWRSSSPSIPFQACDRPTSGPNDNHPHSGLKIRSPREFITAQTAAAWVSGEMGARSEA
ncbi:hypothetical protein EYC08_17840 [Tabrizicola sp. WMC-M-20]|nr:hypothetical protein EYC08_17840 [Tabrizicola sp. WMC-M-20]